MRIISKTFFVVLCICNVMVTSAQSEVLESGTVVEATLTSDVLQTEYMIAVEAGDRVSVFLSSRQFDPLLSIVDAQGNTLISNDDSDGSLNSRIESFEFIESGDYTVVVTSSNGQDTGTYELEYTKSATQKIEIGVRIDDRLDEENEKVLYTFDGEAGTVVSIQLNSDEFDSFLVLSDENDVLTTDDDSGGSLNSLIASFILPETGTYYIEASSFSADTTGAFTLILNTVDTVPIELNQPVSVTVGGSPLYYSFTAEAGDTVSVLVRSEDGLLDTSLNFQDTFGNTIVIDDDSGYIYDPEILDVSIFDTGQYLVILFPPESGDTGDLELQIISTLNNAR